MKWLSSILEFFRMLLPVIGKRQDYKVLTYEVKKDKIKAETLVQIEKAKADLARAQARVEVVSEKADARAERKIERIQKKRERKKKDKDSPPDQQPE